MNKNFISKAGGLLIRDKKVMLERHGGKDVYIIPGGKLESGETAEQALIREFDEEFGIEVVESDLEKVGTFKSQAVHNPDKIVEIQTFIVRKWKGEIIMQDGIEEIIWIDTQNMKDYKISEITKKDVIPLLLRVDLIQ